MTLTTTTLSALLATTLLLCEGQRQPYPLPSWRCVPPGATVKRHGGRGGVNESEGGAWVAWEQGAGLVTVDGETWVSRVWLPVVGR